MKKFVSVFSIILCLGAVVLIFIYVIAPFFQETIVVENMQVADVAQDNDNPN